MDSFKQAHNNFVGRMSPYIIIPPLGFVSFLVVYELYSLKDLWKKQMTNPTQYSKFTIPEKLKNKLTAKGSTLQTIAYGIPFAFIASYVLYRYKKQNVYNTLKEFLGFGSSESLLENTQFRYMLPAMMMLVHFAKRMFEANFIHIMSNEGPVWGAVAIGLRAYTLGTLIPFYFQQNNVTKEYYKNSSSSLIIGSLLYFIGEFGNAYHHYLLRRLRLDNKTDKKYVLPKGGLFSFVWCPHYLFELTAWYGMAATSKHILFLGTALQMTSYLTGRALATKEWYQKQFNGEIRNAIIPFIV